MDPHLVTPDAEAGTTTRNPSGGNRAMSLAAAEQGMDILLQTLKLVVTKV